MAWRRAAVDHSLREIRACGSECCTERASDGGSELVKGTFDIDLLVEGVSVVKSTSPNRDKLSVLSELKILTA